TNLSYCNGEITPGSSNITLYIVWPCVPPRQVAHTLRHMPGLRAEERTEVGEPREHNHAIATGKGKQWSSYPFPVSVQRLRNFGCGERGAVTKNLSDHLKSG